MREVEVMPPPRKYGRHENDDGTPVLDAGRLHRGTGLLGGGLTGTNQNLAGHQERHELGNQVVEPQFGG